MAALQEKFASLEHIRTWRYAFAGGQPRKPDGSVARPAGDAAKQTIVVVHVDHLVKLPQRWLTVRSSNSEEFDPQKQFFCATLTLIMLPSPNSSSTHPDWGRPYYLHHLDQAPGTHAYRLSIQEGLTCLTPAWSSFRRVFAGIRA